VIALKIVFSAKVPEGETLKLSLGNQEKRVDTVNSDAVFEISNALQNDLTVENTVDSLPKALAILLYAIALPFQGLYHILTFDTDIMKWDANVCAYLFRATFKLESALKEKSTIVYHNSSWDSVNKKWTLPAVSLDGIPCDNISFTPNIPGIRSAFLRVLRVTLSVYLIFSALFSYLLFAAVSKSLTVAIVLLLLIITAGTALALYAVFYNYKKLKIYETAARTFISK